MKLLVFTVSFLLAFLLFAVQPMATKLVLPTLGGTPAVWNTAMFTFQLLLLAGYGYAHGLTQLAPRWQWRLHALVVALSCLVLPLMVTLPTSEAMLANPIPYLVAAFTLQLGLPFVALSATQPLLQAWVSRSAHPLSQTPYVLYSASNLGSFAGLLGYVAVVEPMLALDAQRLGWSAVYVVGMLLLLVAGWKLHPAAAEKTASDAVAMPVGWKRYAAWIGLAFLPSSLSLGVTTYITTDVASVPLLWVIGLSLYLLSFVDAFRTRPLVVGFCQRFAPILGLAALMLYGFQGHRFAWGFPFQMLVFAMLAFAIHGWLARLKPGSAALTRFYLCLSCGGALGGVFNGLVAPLLFDEALEYPIVLLVASCVAMALQQTDSRRQFRLMWDVIVMVLLGTVATYLVFSLLLGEWPRNTALINNQTLMMAACASGMMSLAVYRRYIPAFYALAALVMVMLFAIANGVQGYATLFKGRNFFGVERVYKNTDANAMYLTHDTTLHGIQSLDAADGLKPLSYYYYLGPIFEALPVMRAHPMAVMGLGIGSLKCYAAPDQQVDFYEINPMVKQLAEDTRYFHQLRDCPGHYEVLLGDGRIRMAQQVDGKYGVILLDAFSSDAIPAHLLTHEAMEMYRRKLAPGGVLLIHTTNRHLNIWPLLGAHADGLGMVAYGRRFEPRPAVPLSFTSFWVVMAEKAGDVAPVVGEGGWAQLHGEGDRVWTDQYTNLLPYFKAWRK